MNIIVVVIQRIGVILGNVTVIKKYHFDDAFIHLINATIAQIPSIIPNGQAPCKKPYIDPKTQAKENPKINQ